MSNVKNQHYVPQFYLKGFANDKEQIWAFDKTNLKSFPSGPGNLASENYFYDQIEIDQTFGPKFMERSLDAFEGKFAPFLSELLKSCENGSLNLISAENKVRLCEYVSVQILRTKENRQHILQLFNVFEQGLVDKSWLTREETKTLGFDMDAEKAKLFQIKQLMGNEGLKDALFNSLQHHICFIYKNTTNLPFYSSDNPVAKRAHIISEVRSFAGWASKGIEITLPLSSKFLLVLCESTYFKQIDDLKNRVIDLQDLRNIIYYNSLQVKDSYRFVYCAKPDFDLAKEMVESHQDLGNPNRKRTEIG